MEDRRAELLKTVSVQHCLAALGAAKPNVYGPAEYEWSGVILTGDSSMEVVSHWRDAAGELHRYSVDVTVAVRKETVPRG